MITHSSVLAWKIPWTEEPGRLPSLESQRVRHDLATKHTHRYRDSQKGDTDIYIDTYTHTCICESA